MKAIPVTSIVLLVALFLIASQRTTEPERTSSRNATDPRQTQFSDCTNYSLYSHDSKHIWNRVQNNLLIRTGSDGSKWGCDEVDPLLWSGSKHVLLGAKYQETVALLHEFLNSHSERLVRDPLVRAVFQRNLLAVFHWVTEPIGFPDHSIKCCAECCGNVVGCEKERTQLAELLAAMIKAVAISTDEIHRLPDNYGGLRATQTADGFYLPGGRGFALMGRDDGMPAAPIHLSNFPMSAFFVYLRLPPPAHLTTAESIEATRTFSRSRAQVVTASARSAQAPDPRRDNCLLAGSCGPPQFPAGTETALLRRAILVSNEGQPVLSPITETVQLRRYRSIPDRRAFFEPGHDQVTEFRLSERALLDGRPSLRRVADDEKDFPIFNTHGFDFFEPGSPDAETLSPQSRSSRFGPSSRILECSSCHQNPGVGSFTTYSRMQFEPAERQFVLLHATTDQQEEAATFRELNAGATWKLLHAMMP